MRTILVGIRVSDLAASLDFYATFGYELVGQADVGGGVTLAMLKFPDEEFVSLELAYRPAEGPVEIDSGFSHLAVQVDDLAATLEALSKAGLQPGEIEHPGGPDGPKTAWLIDPDGYRIELVQWPPGHPVGMTAADFE